MKKFSFEKEFEREMFWMAVRGVVASVWILLTGVLSGALTGFFFALEGGCNQYETVAAIVAFGFLGFTASLVFGRWVR